MIQVRYSRKKAGITRSNAFKLDEFRLKKVIGKYWFRSIELLFMLNSRPPAVVNIGTVEGVKITMYSQMERLGGAYMRLSHVGRSPPVET